MFETIADYQRTLREIDAALPRLKPGARRYRFLTQWRECVVRCIAIREEQALSALRATKKLELRVQVDDSGGFRQGLDPEIVNESCRECCHPSNQANSPGSQREEKQEQRLPAQSPSQVQQSRRYHEVSSQGQCFRNGE